MHAHMFDDRKCIWMGNSTSTYNHCFNVLFIGLHIYVYKMIVIYVFIDTRICTIMFNTLNIIYYPIKQASSRRSILFPQLMIIDSVIRLFFLKVVVMP